MRKQFLKIAFQEWKHGPEFKWRWHKIKILKCCILPPVTWAKRPEEVPGWSPTIPIKANIPSNSEQKGVWLKLPTGVRGLMRSKQAMKLQQQKHFKDEKSWFSSQIFKLKKVYFPPNFFLAGWERVNPSSQFDSRIVKYTLFCIFPTPVKGVA